MVGLFVLVTLAILAWGTLQLGGFGFRQAEGYPLFAIFDSAYGVEPQTPILIAGIKVGEVTDVGLFDKRARLTFKILKGVQLHRDATVAIRTAGILGEKYIDVNPGTDATPLLMPGEQVPNTYAPPDFEQLADKLAAVSEDVKAITESLRYALASQDSRESLHDTVIALGELTRQLNEAVGENREGIRNIVASVDRLTRRIELEAPGLIDEFRGVGSDVRGFVAGVSDAVEGFRPKIDGGLDQVNRVVAKLDDAAADIRDITDRVNRGEGTVGKLLNDAETAHKIDSALEGVNTVLRQVKELRTSIVYRGEYRFNETNVDRLVPDDSPGGIKSFFGLRIQPKEDKYYQFDIVNDPRGKLNTEREVVRDLQTGEVLRDRRTQTYEDQVVFNAQIAKRFHALTLRGGLLHNSGGVGADYAIVDPHIQVSVEAYDFLRETNPVLRGYIDFNFFDHLFFSVGAEDIINRSREPLYFAGGGLRFDDEDLKLLLATIPSVNP